MTIGSARELRDLERRWALVAERQRVEAQTATLEEKLDEVEQLLLSVDDFGWRQALDDDEPIRARWMRLRERLGVAASASPP